MEDNRSRRSGRIIQGNKAVKDEGWSWLVCLAGFVIYFIILGIYTSFGKVFDEFLNEFKESHSKTAWIGSIANWCLLFFGGTATFLCRRFSCRSVAIVGGLISAVGLLASSFVTTLSFFYVTYSLAFGFGSSLSYTTVVLAISDYFERKRSLALGLATAGARAGTMAMNPIFHHLFQAFGWRVSFRVCSALCLIVVLCGMVMKPQASECSTGSQEKTVKHHSKKQKCISAKIMDVISSLVFDVNLLKSKIFVIWLLALFFSKFGYYIPHTYMILYAKSIGITPLKASTLFSFLGAFSIIGRIFSGMFSQLKFVNTTILMYFSAFFLGILNFFLTFGTQYYYLASFISIFGFLEGSFITLIPIVTLQICTVEQQKSAWGTVLFFQSFSLLLGPPCAGWMFQHTQSYKSVFYLNGFPLVAASLLILLIALMEKRKKMNMVVTLSRSGSSSSKRLEFSKTDWTLEAKNEKDHMEQRTDSVLEGNFEEEIAKNMGKNCMA